MGAMLALALILVQGPVLALGLIRDAEIERTLRWMSTPVFKAAGLPPQSVNIYIVNDDSMNAFVAGGRNVFLHSGLLSELETPSELIGVIAHETGHIAGGHEARRSIKLREARGPALLGLLAGIALGALGGGEAGTAIAAGSQSALLRDFLRHNRAEEAAADQAAVSYMARSGYDPEGLVSVLERFRGQEVLAVGNIDPYVLTHPLSTQRMQLLERRVAEAKGARGSAGGPDQETAYWHARMRAKLQGFLDNPERVLNRLADEPETETTLYAKAVALHRLPSPREAVAAVDRLIAKRPDDAFYLELKGQILYESGDAQAAVPYYRRAVEAAPNQPLLRLGLGRALLALDTEAANREALAVLKAARRADPGDPAALRDLALAYARAGEQGMAALATAERYAMAGRIEDAILHAKRATAILPRGSPAWLRAEDILALNPED